jgi:hypothetical protein
MSRPWIEPGPPAWEASTLEKSHLDSLLAGYSESLLGLRRIRPTSTIRLNTFRVFSEYAEIMKKTQKEIFTFNNAWGLYRTVS